MQAYAYLKKKLYENSYRFCFNEKPSLRNHSRIRISMQDQICKGRFWGRDLTFQIWSVMKKKRDIDDDSNNFWLPFVNSNRQT